MAYLVSYIHRALKRKRPSGWLPGHSRRWRQAPVSPMTTTRTVNLMTRPFHFSLQWRHTERNCVSNHQPHDCLLNRSFRRRSKKTWKLRVTGLCAGNSPVTGEFPAQISSNAENVSIWWRHHVLAYFIRYALVFVAVWFVAVITSSFADSRGDASYCQDCLSYTRAIEWLLWGQRSNLAGYD